MCARLVAVELDHFFVLPDGRLVSARMAQQITLGVMRRQAAWRRRQCPRDQVFCARDIGRRGVCHFIDHPATSTTASAPCASVDPASNANAHSNNLIASA